MKEFTEPIRRITMAAWVAWAMAGFSQATEQKVAMEILRTPGNIRFGVIGGQPEVAAPTLLLVAMSLEDVQREPVYTDVARLLAPRGYRSVVIEPPCHGEDRKPDEPDGLAGWRQRLDRGEDLVKSFNTKVRAVLDHLIAKGLTDPTRVAICGTSRGGFLAFHFATSEPRVKAIGGFSPVTDLLALREFTGEAVDGPTAKLALTNIAAQLTSRPAWLSIGNNDQRVDTDRAIAFSRALVQANARQSRDTDAVLPVELIVAPSAGHSRIERAHELFAAWLLKQMPAGSP